MGEPSKTVQRQAEKLFPESAEEQGQFMRAIVEGGRTPAVVRVHETALPAEIAVRPAPHWLPERFAAIDPEIRIGTTKSFIDGDVYAFDLASAFSLVPLMVLPRQPALVFDMCASPGGKAVGSWAQLQPQHLVCNEVIGKRLGALISNLDRCRIKPVTVLCADPQRCADLFERSADLVIADVPCSGQALAVKGKIQAGAFHRHTIDMNARRQRRVTINSARIVAPGGYLLYTTCTFSIAENEQVLQWILKTCPDFHAVEIPQLLAYRSRYAEFPAYRLFPQQGEGAGAFTCLLQRSGEGERNDSPLPLPAVWQRS